MSLFPITKRADPVPIVEDKRGNALILHTASFAVGVNNGEELSDRVHNPMLYGTKPAPVNGVEPANRPDHQAGNIPPMANILNRIDERLAALGMSRRKASVAAGLGQDYIRDLGRRKNASPGMKAIEALAPVLETTVEWLSSGGDQGNLAIGQFKAPQPVFVSDDLPVYRAVEGGSGYIVVSEKPFKAVDRPSQLANNPEAFAVVVAGESMSPVYEPGDLLLIDPYRPLVRNKNFIFIDDRHGDWKACVKKLLRWDAFTYYVFQHNPAEGESHEFTLKRSEWPRVNRVLGKYDGE